MIKLQEINNGDVHKRIDKDFMSEVEEIKAIRKELGFRKMNNSDRFITSLIIKHKTWKTIKEDIINYGKYE